MQANAAEWLGPWLSPPQLPQALISKICACSVIQHLVTVGVRMQLRGVPPAIRCLPPAIVAPGTIHVESPFEPSLSQCRNWYRQVLCEPETDEPGSNKVLNQRGLKVDRTDAQSRFQDGVARLRTWQIATKATRTLTEHGSRLESNQGE